MKNILLFILFITLYSCQSAESHNISEEQKKDQAFQELIKKIEVTKQESIVSQDKASKQESKIVDGAVNKIVNLKQEVLNLKNELDEKNQKLNGIFNDTGSKFKLLPISNN